MIAAVLLGIAKLVAVIAINAQPYSVPADFVSDVLDNCAPIVSADFVGCEGNGPDDRNYAGWTPSDGFQTGP